MRRGVRVVGFITGEPSSNGVPHVIGVHTEAGEEVFGDLVIDAGGRHSSLPARLEAIGARAPMYGPLNTVVSAEVAAKWIDASN